MHFTGWLLNFASVTTLWNLCLSQITDLDSASKNKQFYQQRGSLQASTRRSPVSLPAVCKGRTGYVADVARNCQVFYNCLSDGTVTTSTCPGNYQFDERSQCCKMPHEVNCGAKGFLVDDHNLQCMGKRGFFADYRSGCTKFLFCEPSGRSRTLSCPDGLLFNEQIGCCDLAETVRCGNQPAQVSVGATLYPIDEGSLFCGSRRPGFYANPMDCATYYFCQPRGSQFLRCPAGQAFNELTSSCDNDLSRCYGVIVDSSVYDCSGRSGWYQGNDRDCRRAFYCNGGVTYMHTCPGSLRWNLLTLSCDTPERVQCPTATGNQLPVTLPSVNRPTVNVMPVYGGMTESPVDISNAITARFPTFPPINMATTQAGSGNAAATTTLYASANSNPGLGIDNNYDCQGKIGYYAIVDSGCSQFVYCDPEGTAMRFECPTTLLFNNSLAVCDWPQNVQCGNQIVPGYTPNTRSPPFFDCRGKDGFFADQNRGGQVFYLCYTDGSKYQYVCPSNLVFNEQTAVCDWPDYMRQAGFVERPRTEVAQYLTLDWNNEPLDCRVRPAGFYSNPTNSRSYGRCTPDGTFVPLRCPETTVFDPVLALCTFRQTPVFNQPPPFATQNPIAAGGYGQVSPVGVQIQTQIPNSGFQPQQGNFGRGDVQQVFTQTQIGGGGFQFQQGNNGGFGNEFGNVQQQVVTLPGVTEPSVYYGTFSGIRQPQFTTFPTVQLPVTQSGMEFNIHNQAMGNQWSGSGSIGGGGYGGVQIQQGVAAVTRRPGVLVPFNSNSGGVNMNAIGNIQGGSGQLGGTPQPRPDLVFQRPNIPMPMGPAVEFYQAPVPNLQGQFIQGGRGAVVAQPAGNGSRVNFGVQAAAQYGFHAAGQQSIGGQFGPSASQTPSSVNQNVNQNMGAFYFQTQGSNTGMGSGQETSGGYIGAPMGPDSRQVPTLCIGRAGMFADRTSGCKWYAVCAEDGNGEIRMCPGNLLFSERSGSCEEAHRVDCFLDVPGIIQPRVPVCQSAVSYNAFVPDVTQSCQTFYKCEQNGQGIGFRCPTGLQFNTRINACDDPRNCVCAPGNGGTINVQIPVTRTVIDTASLAGRTPMYAADYAETADQSMEIEIPIAIGASYGTAKEASSLPLVQGYDSALYADASGGSSHGRLPSFLAEYNDMMRRSANASKSVKLADLSVSLEDDDPRAAQFIAPEAPANTRPVVDLAAENENSVRSRLFWRSDLRRERPYYRPQTKSIKNVFHESKSKRLRKTYQRS